MQLSPFAEASVAAQEPPFTLAGDKPLRGNLTEAAQHSRMLFMTHLTVNGYALIVLAGLDDAAFFRQGSRLKLPVIDASVSLSWFMPALALLSMLVFVYWHMYLRKMWLLANRVSAAAEKLRDDKDFAPPSGDFRFPWIAFFAGDDDIVLRFAAIAFGVFEWALMPLTQLVCFTRTIRLGGGA